MNKLIAKIKKGTSLIIIYLFNCLPIKKNKIMLFSYYGSQYGCNPKYITEYILKNYPKDKFDVVWAFNDLKSKDYITGFRKVRTMSLKYFYELCTSRIVITNFRITELFIKRSNQYYIQTWHSSLRLKQIEKDVENSLPQHYVEMAKMDSIKCDLLLSGCEYSSNIFKRAFWYDGEIFEHGTPRNDVLGENNSSIRERIMKGLNIPHDYKIILYAPTFRKDNNLESYDLNYSKILETSEKKYGGKWMFLVKLHPHLLSNSSQLVESEDVIDVTSYDDIQELLCISDVLISDYSSLIFDFSITKRPCFLYVPDIQNYIRNERNLYFDIMKLPFLCATSNKDLLKKMENFNFEEYKQNLSEFLSRIGSFEKGNACEHMVKHIEKVCSSKNRRDFYEAV
jgi:CDP-glycerol glycerophosphotransferase